MTKILKISIIFSLLVTFTVAGMAQDNLSQKRKQAVDSLALEKVNDLSRYISIIGNKETQIAEANRVINRACELFMKNSEIGVSSIYKKGIEHYKIRQYLERLMRLNYDKVNIEWYNIEYVSDLQKQPDGTYVGVITIYQKFQAFDKENGLVYQDVTKKDVTVYVKRKETQIGGRLIGFWDVMLGDIRVKETTK